MVRSHGPMRRRGAVAPFAALLMVFLLGMVAFAIDIGYVVLAKTDLQNAADAAALAGADALMNSYVTYQLPNQDADDKQQLIATAMANAATRAQEYAGYNAAGDVKSLDLLTADISFGFLDANGVYSSTYSGFPNTVKVTLRRDPAANGSLPLFLGPVLGTNSTDMTATASATIYGAVLNNLSAASSGVLPMTYDVDHWNRFLATGQDPDGSTSIAANGSPQLQVYPSVKYKGNFGLLTLNGDHAGANSLNSWIHDGMGQDDVDALLDLDLIPLSQHNPNLWDWNGENGFKSSNVSDVNRHTDEVYILPLFKAKNPGTTSTASNGSTSVSGYAAGDPDGSGSHYYYNIVQFIGIRIMQTPNGNRNVIVQPAPVVLPDTLMSSIAPAGTANGQFTTVFVAPRLSN